MGEVFTPGSDDLCLDFGFKRRRSVARKTTIQKARRGHYEWVQPESMIIAPAFEDRHSHQQGDMEPGPFWAKRLQEGPRVGQSLIDLPNHSDPLPVQVIEEQLNSKLRNDFSLLLSDWDESSGSPLRADLNGDISIMREVGLPGLAIVFCAVPLIALSPAIGIAGMFGGLALFWLANYSSYRSGQHGWIVGPAGSAKLFAGSVALAVTAVIAAITN
jgi:hypothetical protein